MKVFTLESLVELGVAPSVEALRQRVHRLGAKALPPRIEVPGSANKYLFLPEDVERWLADARRVPPKSVGRPRKNAPR